MTSELDEAAGDVTTPLLFADGRPPRVPPAADLACSGRAPSAIALAGVDLAVGVGRHARDRRRVRLRQVDARCASCSGSTGRQRRRSRSAARPIAPGRPHELRWFRREAQIVFQDPLSSLDPRMRSPRSSREPLVGLDVAERPRRRIAEVLERGRPRPGVAPPLPARVLRRPAAAHRHRPRHRAAPEAARRRRAGERARRVGAGADPRPAARLADEFGLSLVLVSHDLGVVRTCATTCWCCTTASVVERGATEAVSPSRPTPTPGGCSPPSHDCDCVARPRRLLLAAPALRWATQAGLAPRPSHRWTGSMIVHPTAAQLDVLLDVDGVLYPLPELFTPYAAERLGRELAPRHDELGVLHRVGARLRRLRRTARRGRARAQAVVDGQAVSRRRPRRSSASAPAGTASTS